MSCFSNILVDRLLELYDPYFGLHLSKSEYESVPRTPVEYVPSLHRSSEWDYNRIEYFVRRFRGQLSCDPIELDMEWDCLVAVMDGHHRLIAADIAGLKYIPATFGGDLDVLEWLEGKHSNKPEL